MSGLVEDPRVERTREVVLAAVRELIEAEGFHAVTPQRVASETGVSRSTLHRHWPDNRSLLLAALAEPDPVVEMPLLGDLRTDLAVDLHQLRLRFADREFVATLVSLLGESVFDEAFAAALHAHTRHHFARLERVLDAGRASGALRADVAVEVAAACLAGPLFFHRLVLGEEITVEFVDAVVAAFIAANAPASPPPAPGDPR